VPVFSSSTSVDVKIFMGETPDGEHAAVLAYYLLENKELWPITSHAGENPFPPRIKNKSGF
jgi:hypothetical protein